MKRMYGLWISCLLALTLLFGGCGAAKDSGGRTDTEQGGDSEEGEESSNSESSEESGRTDTEAELTLYTYPIGGWGNSGTVSSLLAEFRKEYPGIRISVQAVDYETGDEKVEAAIKSNNAPDLVFEGPERLVANWGARGLMADLNDLWQEENAGTIYDSVRVACHDEEENYYIYPLCMSTHCMAINRDLFEEAGAWQYIDEETHTWSTDDFIAAVGALRAYGVGNVAAIYCAGQSGDQGTRALVNNLYSGTFTDPAHTRYTVNSPENIKALTLLKDMDGILFAPEMSASDEAEKFCGGELAMAFCWNVSMEIRQTVNNPDLDFDIFPMTFPTNDGQYNLQGGIWGFGIFDNGDAGRIEAAKTFIRFINENEDQYTRSVLASTYWPTRDLPDIYANDQLMIEYGIFQPYLGDYYQVTPGWADARTAWWNMLQRIGDGESPEDAVREFEETANAASKR